MKKLIIIILLIFGYILYGQHWTLPRSNSQKDTTVVTKSWSYGIIETTKGEIIFLTEEGDTIKFIKHFK